MKKFLMTIQFHVQAENRRDAWGITSIITRKHLRDLAEIRTCHEEPEEDAKEWIAINEPITPQDLRNPIVQIKPE